MMQHPNSSLKCQEHAAEPIEIKNDILGWIKFMPFDTVDVSATYRCFQGCEWSPSDRQRVGRTSTTPQATPRPQSHAATVIARQQAAIQARRDQMSERELAVRDFFEKVDQERREEAEELARLGLGPGTPPSTTTATRKREFVIQLHLCGATSTAAMRAGIRRETVYDWRAADETFAKEWDDALEVAADNLEASVYERALTMEGMPGVVASFGWLRAHRPQKWSERHLVVTSPELDALGRTFSKMAELIGGANVRSGATVQVLQGEAPVIEGTAQDVSIITREEMERALKEGRVPHSPQ